MHATLSPSPLLLLHAMHAPKVEQLAEYRE
jgi:hypothetical protein